MLHPTREHPSDGSLMVWIPPGEFTMGLPENDLLAEDHEKPLRTVFLSGYWIDVYPVTNARFAGFIADGGYERRECWHAQGWEWRVASGIRQPGQWRLPGWDGPDQPVAGVSWYEADAYARWSGRRLPTDAEWEKAARGTDGRRYPWGDPWPSGDLANFDSAAGRTTPVGLYTEGVSPYGLHDMAGNVNNWVCDWYWSDFGRHCLTHPTLLNNPVLDDALRKRLRLEQCQEKIDRGGGFATSRVHQEVLGCTRKVHWPPESRHPWNGFRTAGDTPIPE